MLIINNLGVYKMPGGLLDVYYFYCFLFNYFEKLTEEIV